jgi:predicted nucleic acid-binding protein
MITAIDTNILLDTLDNDPVFASRSRQLIDMQVEQGAVIVCPIVYSELLVFFMRKYGQEAENHLHRFFDDVGITINSLTIQDYTLAARSWKKYLEKKEVQCPCCGILNKFFCKKCKKPVKWRNHILTDFLIGAHAQNHADLFATRDKGYYKKNFSIKIIA